MLVQDSTRLERMVNHPKFLKFETKLQQPLSADMHVISWTFFTFVYAWIISQIIFTELPIAIVMSMMMMILLVPPTSLPIPFSIRVIAVRFIISSSLLSPSRLLTFFGPGVFSVRAAPFFSVSLSPVYV
ncbi:hypothetical protein Mapa_006806 [Marchantia paleacea]|nr:hypothetical protein Mapa_006806 [Marchantia paleacea]